MKTLITTLTLISLINFSSAQENPRIDWQFGKLGDNLAKSGIITTDIDGDGVDEIISASVHAFLNFPDVAMFFTILEYSPIEEEYIVRRMSNIINQEIYSLQVFDVNQDGVKEIYLGLNNGMVYVYNALTCKKINEFDTSYRGVVPSWQSPNDVTCILYEDINNDAQLDIVVANGDTTYIYNSTYSLIDKIPFGAKYFEVGNIDDDSFNEVVYSNGTVIQLSNNTVVNEYEFYTHNDEVKIGLSDMNTDGVEDIIYSSRDTLFAFDFKANELIWSQEWESDHNYDRYIKVIELADYNGDNIEDIFLGNDLWDALYCYNGANGNKEFNLYDSQNSGVINIAVSDLDNDSNLEVIWAAGANSTASDYFFIHDLSTLDKDWQSKYFGGDFKAFDVGDVDNDGQLEIVSGVFGSFPYDDYGFLTVFDAENKTIEWQNDEEMFMNSFVDDYTNITIGDIDNDNDNELLLGIEHGFSNSFIYVFNSNYELETSFEIDGMSIILDTKIFDIDNDGENELIVTSGTNISGSSNSDEWDNFIHIFDGATGALEWQSEQLAGMGSKIGSLNIGNIDDDEAFEIVAMKYPSFTSSSFLIIIDGNSYETIQDNSMNYTAVSIADIDNDGIEDILAAIDDDGVIEVLDGTSLLSKQTINTNSGKINSITPYDMNADDIPELVITDGYTLSLFDMINSEVRWRSDTINTNIGIFNSIKVGNIDSDDKIEILVNVNHGIFSFEFDYDAITDVNSPANLVSNSSLIFPNPTNNQITVKVGIETTDLLQIQIFDLNGRLVKMENYNGTNHNSNFIEIDVIHLNSGIYNVVVIKDNQIFSSNKMIKF